MAVQVIAFLVLVALIGGAVLYTHFQDIGLIAKSSTPTDSKSTTYSVSQLIHRYVNEERQKEGLKLLAWNEKLTEIAQAHSNDMAAKGYFAHESLDGKTLEDRIREARMPCAFGAENLLQTGNKFSDEQFAKDAVSAWMESTGHRENILSKNYSSEGIAITFNSAGTIAYVTQDFC